MKFSTLTVLAMCGSAVAFAPSTLPRSMASVASSNTRVFAIEDLEAKLTAAPTSKEAQKAASKKEAPKKPDPKLAAAEKAKQEAEKKALKAEMEAQKKAAAEAKRLAAKPKVETKTLAKAEPKNDKPEPKKVAPPPKAVAKPTPPPPAPKQVTTANPNAVPAGIALGTAPLALAGLGALAAGRDFLSKTAKRRYVLFFVCRVLVSRNLRLTHAHAHQRIHWTHWI